MSNLVAEVGAFLPTYLHRRPADDLGLIAQFIHPDAGPKSRERDRLVRELAGHVAKRDKRWKAALRQVERWTTQASERRGKKGFAGGARGDVTRGRLERALGRRAGLPVILHYVGEVIDISGGKSHRDIRVSRVPRDVGPRTPIALGDLQDLLTLAHAVDTAMVRAVDEIGVDDGEQAATFVFNGWYLEEDAGPPRDLQVDGKTVVHQPISDILTYSDNGFTIVRVRAGEDEEAA